MRMACEQELRLRLRLRSSVPLSTENGALRRAWPRTRTRDATFTLPPDKSASFVLDHAAELAGRCPSLCRDSFTNTLNCWRYRIGGSVTKVAREVVDLRADTELIVSSRSAR